MPIAARTSRCYRLPALSLPGAVMPHSAGLRRDETDKLNALGLNAEEINKLLDKTGNMGWHKAQT